MTSVKGLKMAPGKTFEDFPTILTPDEAAELLRIDVSTAKDWCRAGKMPRAFKLGQATRAVWRVKRDDLLAWIESQRAALLAENERLRVALGRILTMAGLPLTDSMMAVRLLGAVQDIAAAALHDEHPAPAPAE
jgi:excisionase family DNA binding protein